MSDDSMLWRELARLAIDVGEQVSSGHVNKIAELRDMARRLDERQLAPALRGADPSIYDTAARYLGRSGRYRYDRNYSWVPVEVAGVRICDKRICLWLRPDDVWRYADDEECVNVTL